MKGDRRNPLQNVPQNISQEFGLDIQENFIVHVAFIYFEVNASC